MNRRRAVVGLVAPFVILPLAARLMVGPIGDAIAVAVAKAAPAEAHVEDEGEEVPLFVERRGSSESAIGAPRRVARWTAPAGSAKRPSPDAGPAAHGGTIVVSASVIAKAIEDKKASARDVVDADGKPFGAKLRGVGRYHAGLQDGDIVIEVGGVRVHSTSEMTEQGLKQAAGGTKLTGKILRGETTYDVVLELPQKN